MGRRWSVVDWDDETIDRVKRLVRDGLSSTQIAARLAGQFPGMTRNSVVGKLYRLGVFGSPLSERKPRIRTRRARTSTPQKQAQQPIIVQAQPERLKLPTPPAELRMPEPESPWIKIEDLNLWTCRFPKGDPANLDEFRYCGAPVESGSWCPHHAAIVYEPRHAPKGPLRPSWR